MVLSRSGPANWFSLATALAGLLAVAVLTLVERGATRAYSSPWTLLLAAAQLAPFVVLLLRTTLSGQRLALPGRGWREAPVVLFAAVVVSGFASPFRGPALLASLTPMAGIVTFFLVHDWLRTERDRRGAQLLRVAAFSSAVVVVTSMAQYIVALTLAGRLFELSQVLATRNEYPLGHSNYTAGLALLALPWLGVAAIRARGARRAGWATMVVLAVAMLISSGSRTGAIAFGVLLLAALVQARLRRRLTVGLILIALVLLATATLSNPRTRTLFFPKSATATALSASRVQRKAMLVAGWRMGLSRPMLGWGVGTTPLVFPKFRGGLDGGVEDALELHSTPAQLWADLAIPGIVCAIALLLVAGRAFWRTRGHPVAGPASVALAGYVVFALADFQLDVSCFTLALAVIAAVLAACDLNASPRQAGAGWSWAAAGALGVVALFGRADPTPAWNVRALALARDHKNDDTAIDLLRRSLASNPDQEIAHFNLGWLLVVRDPVQAEQHFLAAAHLVPDKGAVYFGLALARLNQPHSSDRAVAQALALECLNDPLFLTSPWWRQAGLARLRDASRVQLHALADAAARRLDAHHDPRVREARWVPALADWIDGRSMPGEMLARAQTSERVSYFARRPAPPDFAAAPVRSYRRERTAYPVLMRDGDLPPPVDLFDVEENVLAADDLGFLFPAKGWLPGPVLLGLLDAPVSAKH